MKDKIFYAGTWYKVIHKYPDETKYKKISGIQATYIVSSLNGKRLFQMKQRKSGVYVGLRPLKKGA